jgi:hypothetical protein
VAIAATSMLEIRLAMRHFWRQSNASGDLDQAVSGGAAEARGGVALASPGSIVTAVQALNRHSTKAAPVPWLPQQDTN